MNTIMTELAWIQLKLKKMFWALRGMVNTFIRKLKSMYFTNTIDRNDREAMQVHQFGLFVINRYNKYKNYTPTQIWAVGLGMLNGGHDIRDYDPAKYSGVEMLVLALRDHFKGIGGQDVCVTRYIQTLKAYYPDTTEEVLRLSVMSMMPDNSITPIVITDVYHPELETLYIQVANEIGIKSSVYKNSQLTEIREIVGVEVYKHITNIQDEILK